jgi:hypothetical protein
VSVFKFGSMDVLKVLVLYRVSKGDSFFISIVVMNNAESIWGESAKDYK